MTSPKKPGDAAPPSLFGGAKPGQKAADNPGDGLRMLSGLDIRPVDKRVGPSTPPRRKNLLVLALVAVLAVGAALAWQFADDVAPQLASARVPAKAAAAEPSRAETRPPAAAASAVTLAAASAPATIESVGAPSVMAALAAADAASKAPAHSSPFATLAASEPMAVSASGVAVAQASTRSEPTRTEHAARAAAPASKTASKSTATKVASNSANTSNAGAGRDSDVDLLAAIVTHLDGTKPNPAAKPVAAPKATPPSPSLAQLVQKCKKLGSKDEASCRRQICDGSWGKSPACPAKLAPAKTVAEEE